MLKVGADDSYRIRLSSELRKHGIAKMDELFRLPDFPPEVQTAVLEHLGEMAFSAAHVSNILLGMEGLLYLPKEWLLDRLDAFLEKYLMTDDEWEYMRIADFLEKLDEESYLRFLQKCEEHSNPGIRWICEED